MRKPQTIEELKSIPFYSQFTEQQLKAQCLRCAEGMEVLERQARRTGKKAGGFTLAEILEMKEHYLKLGA